MNTQKIIQRGVERNLRVLGITPFDVEGQIKAASPVERAVAESMLLEMHAQEGRDPIDPQVQADIKRLRGE